MKVVLINPPTGLADLMHPPLGIGLLATILSDKGHDLEIIDSPIEKLSILDTAEKVLELEPEIVGITTTTKIIASALLVAKRIKEHRGDLSIVLGGPHATYDGKRLLERHSYIDFILKYEAEESFPILIENLKCNNLPNTPSLIWRNKKDEICENSNYPPIDNLDDLPIVNRNFFKNGLYLTKDDETTLITTRGCPNKCKFCSTTRYGRKLRIRSLDSVSKEIDDVIGYGYSSIFFSDDTFTFSKDRVLDLCGIMNTNFKHVKWTCNMRLIDFDEKMIEEMIKSNCYRIFVGIESISREATDRVNKRMPAMDAVDIVKKIQKMGLGVHASFLFGLPGDTKSTIQNSINAALEMQPEMISFNIMTPYPGTPLYESPKKYGIIMDDPLWFEKIDWYERPVAGTNALLPNELFSEVREAYKCFLK